LANREYFVGDKACEGCHRAVFEAFERTSHHLTSQLASRVSILGPFTPGAAIVKTSNPTLHYEMTAKGGGYFVSAVTGIAPDTSIRTEKFEIVIGSGKRGQSYLYWKGDELFELPVSYWRNVGWVNSPGYPDGTAFFARPIGPRCLECHSSYFHSTADLPAKSENSYSKDDFRLGIGCEVCHGPGRAHVDAMAQNPGKSAASVIVNPSKLSREREMDGCALCHGGAASKLFSPSFTFVPGANLSNYLELQSVEPDTPIDVHGNQTGLLEKSRCYQESANLTCRTCHNVHTSQSTQATYSSSCLGCHNVTACPTYQTSGQRIATECVRCHMPKQVSASMVSTTRGQSARVTMHNHWIKVYREPNSGETH
jgi:hypothetical protein